MPDQLVRIESGLGNGLLLGITTKNAPGGTHGSCITVNIDDPNGTTWQLDPLLLTNAFYLVHVATGWVCYFSAQVGLILMVDPIDGYAAGSGGENQIIIGDDTGAGLVAINNVDKSLVFDVQGGNPALGTPVVPYKWNGGANQRWRFNAIG
jgi:Ricin-type beta-trefoil lectin domain-like